MSITKELREWWVRKFPVMSKELHQDLTAIADRIDAAHERKVDEKIEAIRRDVEEFWTLLPRDADGEVIHIGDVMAYTDNTKPMEVVALVPPVIFLTEDGPRYADMCRHYHAPTVEDVLEKALNEAAMLDRQEGYWPSAADITNIVNSLASKLRLREDS